MLILYVKYFGNDQFKKFFKTRPANILLRSNPINSSKFTESVIALVSYKKNKNIILSEKGNGIFIIRKDIYNENIRFLLNNTNA